jgi:hypothetical protein
VSSAAWRSRRATSIPPCTIPNSACPVGARGLETVMEQVLRDDLYELDGKRPVKLSGKIVRARLGK